jgi:hypothetical protein
MAQPQNYSASVFMLEIEGKPAGLLRAVGGGEPFAAVTTETDTEGVVRKRLDPVQYVPISISFGISMAQELYQWMADFLNRKSSTRSGAIVFCDYQFKEQSRLVFDKARISELTFPALDRATKEPALFTLVLQPEATRISFSSAGSTVSGIRAKASKAWTSDNYLLKIDGLEAAAGKVTVIDAITVKQTVSTGERGESPNALTIPDLTLTINQNQAKPFYDYFEQFALKGNSQDERNGTLEFLDKTGKTTLFVLELSHVGIFKIQNLRLVAGVAVNSRVTIALYCEEMRLKTGVEAIGSDQIPPPPIPLPTPSTNPTNTQLSETILGIIGGTIRGEEAIRAALGAAALQQTTSKDAEAASALVARRLLETTRAVKPDTSLPIRDDGSLLGERWATERATLAELEQVAALAEGEWTAIRLENEHSLIAQLREEGVISADASEALDLERDSFVEGLVAGAARVLRSAAPHLNGLPTQK